MTGTNDLPLKQQRGNIKRLLTVSETFLTSINEQSDLTALNLEFRLEKHLELWEKFDVIQSQLDNELAEEEIFANPNCERTLFENRFHKISGLFRKHINSLAQSNNTPVNVSQTSTPSENENQNNEIRTNNSIQNNFLSGFQLPKLQAPTFHGGFDTWLEFHDSFKSLCHENSSIPTIHKFHYLKSCLKNEAAEVIASIETTSENYQIAWDLLKTRFDNRRYIVECHIEALFKLQNISKEYSIRTLLDNFQKHVRALKALEAPVDQWDLLLIYIIKDKLNNYNREKWKESIEGTKVSTLTEMISFLERRALIENTQAVHKSQALKSQNNKTGSNYRSNYKGNQTCLSSTVNTKTITSNSSCPLCSNSHSLFKCEKFLQLATKERYNFVKTASICHNCFLGNHKTIECKRPPCRTCHKPHNILLHFTRKSTKQPESSEENIPSITTSLISFQDRNQSQVVLGTAIVDILNNKGNYRPCRALLDSCSQCNSITENFATLLGLPKRKTNIKLKGVENLHSEVKSMTSTKVKSRYENTKFAMSFLIFQEISEKMPSLSINRNSIKIPNDIFLADPTFHEPSDIDILIGAEYFYDILRAGQIRVKGQAALFQETELGWIFAGLCVSPRQSTISCNLIKYQELPILWELGEESSSKHRSQEENRAESHFTENVTRSNIGRYCVQLPFNDKLDSLGDSRNTVFQRFHALERRFSRDSDLKCQYSDCIQDYINKGHMSLIENQDSLKSGFYLSRHAVKKETSLTTKTRVVFDGSAKAQREFL